MQAVTVTRLTSSGSAALATIRVSGTGAVALVDSLFHTYGSRRLSDLSVGSLAVGRWGTSTGEEIVVGRVAADTVEIHCHGGAMASQAVLESLHQHGAQSLAWRDWSIQHEPDRIAAEALAALSQATTEHCALLLLEQYQGALRRAVESICELLDRGEAERALNEMERLCATSAAGMHLASPFRVVLVGAPNAGKSSLVNRLLGFERAIVFDQPGTTRDVLEAQTAIGGWPMHLSDTAGMRAEADPIEQAGMAQAMQAAEGADLTLLCIAKEQDTVSVAVPRKFQASVLRVGTKADLGGCWPEPVDIETSALSGSGIKLLLRTIERTLVSEFSPVNRAVVFTPRQLAHLNRAQQCLAQGELAEAGKVLAGLVGRQGAGELA